MPSSVLDGAQLLRGTTMGIVAAVSGTPARAAPPACFAVIAGATVGDMVTADDVAFGGIEVLAVACAALLLGTLGTAAVVAWATFVQAVGVALGTISVEAGALTVVASAIAAAALPRIVAGRTAPRPGVDTPPPRARATAAGDWRARGLTARECEVVSLALWGFTADQIGRHLYIGRRTVETHLSRIYSKFGVHSRAEFAELVFAMTRGTRPPAEPALPDRGS
jgi:DNA-binding NarL/FixJ family response regulator